MVRKGKIGRLKDALDLTELICIENECLEEDLLTDKERHLHSQLMLIYKIVHVSHKPSCHKCHKDWEDQFQKLREKLL